MRMRQGNDELLDCALSTLHNSQKEKIARWPIRQMARQAMRCKRIGTEW